MHKFISIVSKIKIFSTTWWSSVLLTKRSFARVSVMLLGLGFLIMFTVGGASLYLVRQTRAYADNLTKLQQANNVAYTTFSLLQDAETGQRGYLLTNNPIYLTPYNNAVRLMPEDLRQLASSLSLVPDGAELRGKLVMLVTAKLAELDATITRQQQGLHEDALRIVDSSLGKNEMDLTRGVMQQIISRLDHQRDQERRGLFLLTRLLLSMTWIGLILIVAVAGVAIWVVAHYIYETEMARKKIESDNTLLEQRVRERTADLEEANEDIQRFAYIVSHDLRGPLVNIMGFTSELQHSVLAAHGLLDAISQTAPDLVQKETRVAIEQDMPEAINFIRTSGQRMDGLIKAILKLAREGRRNLTPEKVDMEALFQMLVSNLQHQLATTMTEITVESPMPDVISDRLALEQIFGNLMDNAVKYLQAGRPGRITVRGKRDGGQTQFVIEDNGRGIEARDHNRVFELFRRSGVLDKPGEGIGLAFVKSMVRRLGGRIDFTSQPGQGTVFTVVLPSALEI
jgi:signal transduction histidine kinase